MTTRFGFRTVLTIAAATIAGLTAIAHGETPLALGSTRITISGTSNIHAYTATTSTVRLVRAELAAAPADDLWSSMLTPGAIDALEIAIPAASLTSPREGLDKNMHKALKVGEHADIVFRLARVEALDGGAAKLTGTLTVAGVERDVTIDVRTARTAAGLVVSGQTTLLMTDFGIKPPTAMLGMLKTDPKVTVAFEATLRVPLT